MTNSDDKVTYLCQNCGKRYQPANSTDWLTIAFCSHVCHVNYINRHGRLPPFGAEIPLGDPEPCTLQSMSFEEAHDYFRSIDSIVSINHVDGDSRVNVTKHGGFFNPSDFNVIGPAASADDQRLASADRGGR